MTVKAHCTVCNKDFEMDDKWKTFVEKYPDRVKCPDCMKGGASKSSKTSSSSSSKVSSVKASQSQKEGKQPVNAEMFKRAYDELLAEFADIKDDVAPYLGGWVSTIVINRSK